MKRFLSLTVSAVLLAELATTVLVSCKKDMQKVACIANQISNKTEAQAVFGFGIGVINLTSITEFHDFLINRPPLCFGEVLLQFIL